jgi:hypothetical protein
MPKSPEAVQARHRDNPHRISLSQKRGRQASRAALDLWNAVVDRDGMKGAGYLQTCGHKPLLALEILPAGQKGRIVNQRQPLMCSGGPNAGDGGLQELAMRSAYNVHPENLHRKAGLALAFIVFGSIAGASGVVVQMAGHEPNADGRSVIAAIPLNPSATLSTIVSPALSPVSASDIRQSTSPSNSAQAALVDATTTAVTAPATTSATEPPQQPVAASKKPQKTARSRNRRDRGWYDTSAWRQQYADYGRGRGYGHERPISSW